MARPRDLRRDCFFLFVGVDPSLDAFALSIECRFALAQLMGFAKAAQGHVPDMLVFRFLTEAAQRHVPDIFVLRFSTRAAQRHVPYSLCFNFRRTRGSVISGAPKKTSITILQNMKIGGRGIPGRPFRKLDNLK